MYLSQGIIAIAPKLTLVLVTVYRDGLSGCKQSLF